MSQASSKGKLRKELGFFSVFALSTGATLSAGFFLLPAIAAQEAGAAINIAYLIAAIPLIPATFSIVELATAMPRAGGAYYFLDRSLGPMMGTIGGIGTWFALVLKTAFALVGMGAYLTLFFPQLPMTALAVAFALLFGVINLLGAKGAGKFQLALVFGLLALLAWMFTGYTQVDWNHFDSFLDSGWKGIFQSAGLVYISYVGVTKVASVSEEVKDPVKTLPRAVFASLLVTVVVYFLGTTLMVGALGVEGLTAQVDPVTGEPNKLYYAPVAATANVLFGTPGMIALTVAAVLAFSSVANAGILSASRYPLAMSRDDLLPKQFQKLSPGGIPRLGVLLTVGLILVLLVFFPAKGIAKLASAFQLLMFALLCVAVIAMRESKLDSYDPSFRSPLYPWMQIAGIISALMLFSEMGWMSILFSLGMVAGAVVWFFRYAQHRVNRLGAIYHAFEQLGQYRHEPLDAELRGIMAEKGLREEDPFDDVVARSCVIDLPTGAGIDEAARRAAEICALHVPDSAEHIREGFQRSVKLGALTIGNGGALPHLRVPHLERPEMVLVRCKDGIQIDHLDDFGEQHAPEQPVRAIFFLVSSEENPGQHLRILAHIAGQLENEEFMPQWSDAADEQEIKEALLRNERYVSIVVREDTATSEFAGRLIRELTLPESVLIAIIRRGERSIVPRGSTLIQNGDRLTIIGEPGVIASLFRKYHD